jgi:hypothetical protein
MGENVQPNQNKDQTQKAETQTQIAEQSDVFCPVTLAGESLDGLENPKAEMEQAMQELLKTVNEEGAQLNQFLVNESKLILEVCSSLTAILKKLEASFNIPPEGIPFRRKVRKAVLNKSGELTLTYEKDENHSAPLAEYPPDIVMAILWDVIPELARTMTIYRKRLNTRANFFEKVKKELKTIANAIDNEEKREPSKEQSSWC